MSQTASWGRLGNVLRGFGGILRRSQSDPHPPKEAEIGYPKGATKLEVGGRVVVGLEEE